MSSARHPLLRRCGHVLPTFLLALTAAVGILATSGTDAGTAPAAPAAPPRVARVSYADGVPLSKLGRFYRIPGGVRVTGWAFDPNAKTTPLTVFASIDGKLGNSVIAKNSRPTLPRTYPGVGTAHGFNFVVPVPEGRHTVCVLAKNIRKGHNATIGCLTKATFDYGPTAALNAVDTRPGAIHVRGWAFDQDNPKAAITTRIAVDGVTTSVIANRSRSDVARAYPSAGAAHGFETTIPAAQGSHSVCITTVNIGFGSNNRFACRTVVVNDNPIGQLSLRQSAGKLRLVAWSFDRDNLATPLKVSVKIDNGPASLLTSSITRTDIASQYRVPAAGRGISRLYSLPEGTHTVCVTVENIGYGSNLSFGCRAITLDYTPTAVITSITQDISGIAVTGWAKDPDTTAAIPVALSLDGRAYKTVTANRSGSINSGYNFALSLPAGSGTHKVCAVGINQVSGTHNSAPACRSIALAMSPVGSLDSVARVGNNLQPTGWAFDADTSGPVQVAFTVDGAAAGSFPASARRDDVAKVYPALGPNRGFAPLLTATPDKHTVCATITNVGGGSDTSLGCEIVIAVNPTPPSAPLNVGAQAGYGSVTATWSLPADDGGAPPSSYRLVASPGGRSTTVPGTSLSGTITGLSANVAYTVTVSAVNVAGTSPGATSAAVTTLAGPQPQTTPAPVSVSRYVRNIRTCNAAEMAQMRSFGQSDAARNVSGHRYMMLLDIGGQSQAYGGVVLSATTRFVTYQALLACSKSYVDGYAGAMKATAPAVIAIGVNNDMDVSTQTGVDWATKIVNPLLNYAKQYPSIRIAGANDIEPGFTGSYAATRNWLSGYLSATTALFVFNGSADGCAWTVTNRSCNNGWSMAGLYNLAAGMRPAQTVNLPQIYNFTMADQWKYISLTGVQQGLTRINFAGPLTEVTACAQAGSCNSISGSAAWQRLWNNLQSHPALRVSSLPYATDLRIDS